MAELLSAGGSTSDTNLISDGQFIRDLKRLKELRSFLIQEAVSLDPEDPATISFGKLNTLQYSYEKAGRAPTQDEWAAIEFHTQTLFRVLTEPQRRKFILGEIPVWMSGVSIALALIALASLMGAIVVQNSDLLKLKTISANTLPFYLIWLMSLGAIGSIAFIGMNALSVQQDITFDLSNRRLMVLRITLGALFGLVLTVPFGFDAFMEFIASVSGGRATVSTPENISLSKQAVLLLLPFILGFSTSLVIMILNRLVEAIQVFFGRTGATQTTSLSSQTKQQERLLLRR